MDKTIRVILVDEYELVRNGIRLVLEKAGGVRVVGEARDADAAIEMMRSLSAEVVIIDAERPDAVRALKAMNPSLRVLVLSAGRDQAQVGAFLRAGADGYLLKQSPASTLIRVLQALVEARVRRPVLDPLLQLRASQADRLADEVLSEREREILALAAAGHTSKGIARQLHLSPRTVDNHRARIMAKLQVENCVQAATRALQLGLIASPTGRTSASSANWVTAREPALALAS
jgi:DNA-binding NarL/FixJ family response regulator